MSTRPNKVRTESEHVCPKIMYRCGKMMFEYQITNNEFEKLAIFQKNDN